MRNRSVMGFPTQLSIFVEKKVHDDARIATAKTDQRVSEQKRLTVLVFKMVPVEGLEPPTSRLRSDCSTN